MKSLNPLSVLAFIILLLLSMDADAQRKMDIYKAFYENTPEWVQTNGPAGGYISDIEIDPSNPSILYAAGSRTGIYRSVNGGDNWYLVDFPIPMGTEIIEIDPNNSAVLYSDYNNLSKSIDSAKTWQAITTGFGDSAWTEVFELDPLNSNHIYMAGNRRDESGVAVYKSENGGSSWVNIGSPINAPEKSDVTDLSVMGNGKLFVGINDLELQTWHKGKVFYSDNDGQSWNEINFGQSEDRFIVSVYVNPHNLQEVWITEGPLYNEILTQPTIYRSDDGGSNWQSVTFPETKSHIMGASSDGKMYLDGPYYTSDKGNTFVMIKLPDEIRANDMYDIAIHPANPNILYLPTRAGGIAYSKDYGSNWVYKNEGILTTRITHIKGSPIDPATIFASSFDGNGTFRSMDYGQTWKYLDPGGLFHPWVDELTIDPVSPNNIWYIPDIPYIQKSIDGGDTWNRLTNPDSSGEFNVGSVYAMASSGDNILYALNNGFGIYKGKRSRTDVTFDWEYLMLSEIDYSYTLAVDPTDPQIVLSGYSRKPFETSAKIMGSGDGGKNWSKLLDVTGAEAITSVVIDPHNRNRIYAASTGEEGGILWQSSNKGQAWEKLNDFFNYTTIHSFATGGSDSPIALAGVWGGGTYLTDDHGKTWKQLNSKEAFSAAAIAIPANDTNIVYLADRTRPVLYRSNDGGIKWMEYFDAGPVYRRLMNVTIDPANHDRVYVSAMKMEGPGKLGALFRIEKSNATDINGILPKVPLNIAVDPNDSLILYAVLHESGVYKTVDGGLSWTDISSAGSNLPEAGFNNLVIDPNNSNTLYLIGGCDVRFETFESAGLDPHLFNTVYISENGGVTWTNLHHNTLGTESGEIKSLVFYKGMSNIIFLGAQNGVYYTTDGGTSWNKNPGLSYNTLGGIAISDSIIYAFTNGAGVFTGEIQGDLSILWDTVSGINTPVYFAQILKDHSDSNTLYASGYPGGIFKSTDHGKTWNEKNFGMVSFSVDDPLRQGYYAFVQSQSNPDILYLGLYEKGVYRSANGGDTWYQINGLTHEMRNKAITSIALDQLDPEKVYIGTEDGVYFTSDGGQNWSPMNDSLVSRDVKTLYMSSGNKLYAGTRGYGLYQWTENHWIAHDGFGNWGQIWPIWDDRPKYQYTSLLIHPDDNSRMIMGTFPQGIYKSTDGGNTWRESNVGWTNDGVFYLICHPENPEIVYSGTYNGMNRSLDFGEHWEMWDEGMPPEQWVFSIDFNPLEPDIMYACSKNGENEGTGRVNFRGTVMKSYDGGEHWKEITNGLVDEHDSLHQEFYNIIVDRFDTNTVYLAAQFEGIYISRDGGENWESWNEGLTNKRPGTNGNNVTNSFSLSTDFSMLYFGTDGSGVWRRMITPILPVNKLSARVIDHEVKLSWSFADLNQNFSHYNVYRSGEYFTSIDGMTPVATITSLADTFHTDASVTEGEQYFYAVTTSDISGYENNHLYVLGPVVDHLFHITTTILDTGMVGRVYRDTLEALGGDPPYTWEVASGTLTNGLSLMAAGIIEGIPEEAGQFQITFSSMDSRQPPNLDSVQCQLYIRESTGIIDQEMPGNFALWQNSPNPFKQSTLIKFDLPKEVMVKMEIYNFLGRKIATILNQKMPPGSHQVEFNGDDLPSGNYFYMMKAGDYQDVKRAVLIK